jgi:HK97 family phage major capsid protein
MNKKEELLARKRELNEIIKPLVGKKSATPEETKILAEHLTELESIKVQLEAIEQIEIADGEQVIADKKAFDAEVKVQVEKILAEKAPPVKDPGVNTDADVTKDEADQPFPTGGEFFQAVKNAALHPAYEDVRLKSLSLKATGLSENVPADGGYLLQPQVSGGIIERMYDVGDILSRVASDPIGPNSNSMLYNAIDETSRADGSRYGGVLGYWLAEAGTKQKSKPTFRQMELKLKKVAALCYATDELLEDSVALESWLTRTVPEELRFQVESAFYRGNGVGKPLGIMNSPCLISPLRVDANQVDEVDIANMWARRWQGVNDYVWLANASVFPQLINLTVGNFPFLLPIQGAGQGDPAFSLYGKQYIESEYTYALGTTGDIMLASLSQYQTINKGGVQSATSIHVQFLTDETVFRFVYRTDGEPLWNSALTPYDGGNTLSPFVVLSAASV